MIFFYCLSILILHQTEHVLGSILLGYFIVAAIKLHYILLSVLVQKLAIEQAYAIFAFLDAGSDGSVSEDEFIFGCVQDQNLLETLKIEF